MLSDEVGVSSETKPRFWIAAEAEAARRGISPQEVLDEDLRQVNLVSYPSPMCLRPHEVEIYACHGRTALPASRLAHLDECRVCSSLAFVASHPSDDETEEAMHEIMAQVARSKNKRAAR